MPGYCLACLWQFLTTLAKRTACQLAESISICVMSYGQSLTAFRCSLCLWTCSWAYGSYCVLFHWSIVRMKSVQFAWCTTYHTPFLIWSLGPALWLHCCASQVQARRRPNLQLCTCVQSNQRCPASWCICWNATCQLRQLHTTWLLCLTIMFSFCNVRTGHHWLYTTN